MPALSKKSIKGSLSKKPSSIRGVGKNNNKIDVVKAPVLPQQKTTKDNDTKSSPSVNRYRHFGSVRGSVGSITGNVVGDFFGVPLC